METPERRYLPTNDYPEAIRVEKRDGQPPMLAGISPPWNSLSVDLGGFREMFAASAFDKILGRHRNDPRGPVDVPFLFDHQSHLITGRTTNGRLRLTKTDRGLAYEHEPLQTTNGRDLVMLVEDRTITGASFAFTVDPEGEQWTQDEKGSIVRTVTEASGLYDISAVTRPAYTQSSIAPRSLELWSASRRAAETGGLLISLDFDRTFTAAPGLWRSFIRDAVARGNRVCCITRREDTDANREAVRSAFGDMVDALAATVLCGPATQKRDAAAAAGLSVDIWIDDAPETVPAAPEPRGLRVSSAAGAKAAAAAALMRLRGRL